MSAIAVSDLDKTLIIGARELHLDMPDDQAPRLLCVELWNGRPLTYMTETGAAHVAELNEAGVLVPVTTRTVKQFRRIHLPGPPAKFALCANGGRLLRDGVEDLDFTIAVDDRLASSSAPFAEVLAELERVSRVGQEASFVKLAKGADGLFCYAVFNGEPIADGWLDDLAAFAAERAWGLTRQGRKVYLVPDALTKMAAVAEVVAILGADRVLAAGDSLLDGTMLEAADAAIRPAHGELEELGWQRPHVTVTSAKGVRACEEVSAWLRSQTG
jgi:hypothetical protein